ncbi:mitochondrial fission 1 protein-like [Mytilus californianus]|uniref:Mitochondrial fission 1 protein n=1 Tax=Mytilus coruscus TaxID=42192 RepID=A0A6J8CG60_MYTCO|nr:mitochondrial fission 1 protein-like [Mytilus californianus]CAC5395468.1 FIS1 [Mytilus coruscus]
MDRIVNEICDENDLKKFQVLYQEQVKRGVVDEKAQFEYAWCLIRGKAHSDTKKGIALLEDLFRRIKEDEGKRDYLFCLSLGYTRLKEYEDALKYAKALLKVEPENRQAQSLKHYIEDKMKKDGLMGMAIVGGAAIAIGGLVGLGVALTKKLN